MNILKICSLLFAVSFALPACEQEAIGGFSRLQIEVFIDDLDVPWGMAFLPDGDFIFCERNGQINLLEKGNKKHERILSRSVQVSEGGLLGLAVDPNFKKNHFIYIYETLETNRVVRLVLNGKTLTEDKIILSGIPKAMNHDGGALRFGPDGFLYVGTGDAQQPSLAQDKNSLAGKILRIDREGNTAPGNPFNNKVWSYGHRNVQGFDWNKEGRMVATEHGPSSEFGWCCHDEINLIEAGKNYGWPLALGGTETDTLTPPLYQSGMDTWAPSGCTFIRGKEWESWENNFILAGLRGERLIRFAFNSDVSNVITKADTLKGHYLRLRNILQAPDGSLLFSSSNKGGSTPSLPGDDKIYRMFVE